MLACSVPCSALADTRFSATPAELVATPSDFSGIQLFSTGVSLLDAPSVTNTVDYAHVLIQLCYYDMSNNVKFTSCRVDSDGNWSLKRPADYAKPYYISVVLSPKALPPVGKYKAGVALRFNAGVTFNTANKPVVFSSKEIDNAGSLSSSFYATDYVLDLDAYAGFSVNLATNVESIIQTFYLNSLSFNTSGYANGWAGVQFTRLSSSASTDGSVAGSGEISSDDIQQNISSSVGNISSGVADVADSLKELIQTISNQLTALWGQFSAVYTNMFSAWNTHVTTITQGVQGVTDEVSNSSEEIQENQDKNTNIITEALSALGNFIIEGLKGLFIPSDEFFSTWFNDLYEFFSDRLGFLMLPVDLVVDFAGLIADADSSFAGVPFPEISWDGTVIVSSQMVGFDVLETDWGRELQQLLYFAGDLIMIGALLNLMHRKFEEVLSS